jgi:hypothetical protein
MEGAGPSLMTSSIEDAELWPQGNCATVCCTKFRVGIGFCQRAPLFQIPRSEARYPGEGFSKIRRQPVDGFAPQH